MSSCLVNDFMRPLFSLLLCGIFALAGEARADGDNVVKLGVTRYTTDSTTNGISGIGVPPGADTSTGDATTALLVYERMLPLRFGAELVIGYPPTIKASATGSISFLGTVLSAKAITPTLLINYHFPEVFGGFGPYFGLGVNYTRFIDVTSTLAPQVKLGYSVGPAAQIGTNYTLTKNVGMFVSVAKLDVKTKVVATGVNVLTTTINLHPMAYTMGATYSF